MVVLKVKPSAPDHRGFIVTNYSHPVSVKDAVAAMEARLQDDEKPRRNKPPPPSRPPPFTKPIPSKKPPLATKPPTLIKPPHLATRNVQRPAEKQTEVAARKIRHRRSMSDPNLDVSFQKMKNLWDQKSNDTEKEVQDKKSNQNDKPKTFHKKLQLDDDSNNNSIVRNTGVVENKGNDTRNNKQKPAPPQKSFLFSDTKKQTVNQKQETNDDQSQAMNSLDLALPPRRSNSPKPHVGPVPPLPPRPHGTKARSETTEDHITIGPGMRPRSDHKTEAEVTPPPRSNSLSVTEKALLFGGSKVKNDVGKPDESRCQSSERRDTSWLHSSDNKPSDDRLAHSRHRNDSEIATYHKDRKKKRDDESPIAELQKQARQNKDRRVKRPSGDSIASFESFDDDERKGNPLLGSVGRRRSKEVNDQLGPGHPESPFLRTSRPNSLKKGQQRLGVNEEGEVESYRRSSALQSAIENKLFSSGSISSTNSSPQGSLKQLREELELALDKNGSSSSHFNPTHSRTHSRERANTSDSIQTPPALPPKLNRHHRSNSGNRVVIEKTKEKPKRPPPPMIPPHRKPGSRTPKKAHSLDQCTSINANEFPSPKTQGQFGALKMYNDVAKEFSEDDPKRRSGSICSSVSIDSGFRTSLEVPSKGVNMAEWSDFDNSDEDDSVLGTSLSTPDPTSSVPQHKVTNEVKLHNIAKELLSTEESYVAVLHLIDQVFHKQILDAATQKHIMPEQVVNNIFCHIPAIYQFHSNFLLPQLKARLTNWETTPKIGDIMTQAAPFLKMYSLYVQNFDEAMNTIKLWSEKSNSFKALLESIQKTPECQFLTLQHHMLGPVQRVPRYRMLLEDYVKRLPEDSDDRQNSATALDLITKAATHSNETMKKIEKFHKLVNVFNSLVDVNFDIVDVTRELLKEGKITKISARNGEKYERYLYLFSDMLLCCTPLRRLQGKSYRVTAKIDLDGMKLNEVKSQSVPFAFCVNGLQRSMEFATNSAEDTEVWKSAIQNAIDELENRQQTFRNFAAEHGATDDAHATQADGADVHNVISPIREDVSFEIPDSELGTRAPRWVKDQEVTMCMICSKTFNKLRRRRHHCRACGRVICAECSEHKFHLQYERGKSQKVCSRCYEILNGQRNSDSSDGEKKGVLEVEADIMSVDSVLAEYLFVCESEKKRNWTKTWCVIPRNELCLYFYGAHQDIKAQMTLPLPGFQLTTMEGCLDHKHCFKLIQGRTVFCFGSNDTASYERWMFAMGQASLGEDISREKVWNADNRSDSDGNPGE